MGWTVDVETDQNVAELLAEQDDDKSLKEREDTKANRN